MNIGLEIKKARTRLGLTQVQLAARARLSVATLQNIEANRANPEFSTLTALFKILRVRMKFEFESHQIDFDELALFGCPLLTSKPVTGVSPSRFGLIERANLIDARDLKGREAKAVSAWVHALKDHFVSVWNDLPPALRAWAANQPVEVKLRRIALSRLSEFL